MDETAAKLSGQISSSQMRGELSESPLRKASARGGDQTYALCIATVTNVDYKKLEVNLRIETGETFNRVAIPINFPGAGARHFLGAVPEVGDACVVGWGSMESGSTQLPYILSWVVPGVTAGYDWMLKQPFGPEEYDPTSKEKFYLEGLASRVRHKLRHMEPGNVLASSSQGSDLLLNESALLTNRRGGEVRLEDRDNSFIVRTLQQFHAGAGFRTYSGMVQRDARLLPRQMVSDGTDWAAPRQVDPDGRVLTEAELGESETSPGRITPARVFQRDEEGNPLVDLEFSGHTDPYEFLRQGLLINSSGRVIGNPHSDAIYGGKQIYRVSVDGQNGASDHRAQTLTEILHEITHTHDGTLPVTEQTDGFDSDKLGSTRYITLAAGSVVGNDPFTDKGRSLYGLPLKPAIFDGDVPAPGMVSGVGSDLGDHGAFLFLLRPPVGKDPKETLVSFTKDGRLMLSLGGPRSKWSAEIATQSGVKAYFGAMPSGVSAHLTSEGSLEFNALQGRRVDNVAVSLRSERGGVHLYGGGAIQRGGPGTRVSSAPGGGAETDPNVFIEASKVMLFRAGRTIRLEAPELILNNLQDFSLSTNGSLVGQAGDAISWSAKTYNVLVNGKATYTYGGPLDGDSSNGPLRETKFTAGPSTGFTGGVADRYLLEYGDRDEVIKKGDHSTEVQVGNATYRVGQGTLLLEAEQASITMSDSGIDAKTDQGSLKLRATAGSATLEAQTKVTVKGAQMDLASDIITFKPINGDHTPPGGTGNGGILTDGVLNPLTGQAFSQTGTLGVPTIRVQ